MQFGVELHKCMLMFLYFYSKNWRASFNDVAFLLKVRLC